MTLFDARFLAPLWLSVAVASSKDGARPALDRTVLIEQYPEGVRLTATDSYVLLTAWVPNVDHELEDPPGLDEAPLMVAVAMDPHGRARGLLAHVLGLVAAAAKADVFEPIELGLTLGVFELLDEDDRVSFSGMDVPYVVLEFPDQERVKLRTFEGEFPSWRGVVKATVAKRTTGVALSASVMGQMAKLAKYNPEDPLRFTFGGESSPVKVEVTSTSIEGVLMPVRWDFDTDAPRDDNPTPPTPDATAEEVA